MQVNFFAVTDYSQSTCNTYFGILDEEVQPPVPVKIAYENEEVWNCKVVNSNAKTIDFYPIDNAVKLVKVDGNKAKTCDAMLRVLAGSQIIFVELKNRKKAGVAQRVGIEQLKETISYFNIFHKSTDWVKREAYVCNMRHPHCPSSFHEKALRFRAETNFRLYYSQKIEIS